MGAFVNATNEKARNRHGRINLSKYVAVISRDVPQPPENTWHSTRLDARF